MMDGSNDPQDSTEGGGIEVDHQDSIAYSSLGCDSICLG